MSSAVLTIDLLKNPEVAALVADVQPGQKVYACFTIKDKDDQSLNIRLKEMGATCDELKENASEDSDEDTEDAEDDGQSPEGAEAEAPTPPEPAMRSTARKMASNDSARY